MAERDRRVEIARDDAWTRFEQTGVLSLGPLTPGPILVGTTAPLGTTTMLVGMACPTNRVHTRQDGTRERILPGAFKEFLRTQPPICAYMNHDHGHLLGSTSGGQLEVSEVSAGLVFRLALSPTNAASQTAIETVARRRRLGVSVAFRLAGTACETRHGVETFTRAAISELSMLTPEYRPALAGTWAMDDAHGGRARFALEVA